MELLRFVKRMKLKPCPFCGGKAKLTDSKNDAYVTCNNCKVMTNYYKTGKQAIKAWNTRHEPENNK